MANRTELEQSLHIDDDALDRCLTEQPGLFYHVATALAQANSQRDLLKLQLDEAMAEADGHERDLAFKREQKITEAAIQNSIKARPDIQKLQRACLEARTEAERWSALKEAYQQRSYMLKEIVGMRLAEFYSLGVERGAASGHRDLGDMNQARAEQKRRVQRLRTSQEVSR